MKTRNTRSHKIKEVRKPKRKRKKRKNYLPENLKMFVGIISGVLSARSDGEEKKEDLLRKRLFYGHVAQVLQPHWLE